MHEIATSSLELAVRSSRYLPDNITFTVKGSETSCTYQTTSSVPFKTEAKINRHTFDTKVLHCKRGYVLQ